jgi:hypothetical protein
MLIYINLAKKKISRKKQEKPSAIYHRQRRGNLTLIKYMYLDVLTNI